MADVHIDDDDQTLASMLTRLPAATTPKTERMIFITPNNTSVPVVETKEHSTVKNCFPFPFPFEENRDVVTTIVGTYCGTVLLHVHVKGTIVTNETRFSHIVRYNPSTRMSYTVRDPNSSSSSVFGFGYGENPFDLKIVRFRKDTQKICKEILGRVTPSMVYPISKVKYYCDVLTLATDRWSTSEISLQVTLFIEDNNLGTFVNGFLYWFASTNIVALSVKDLVISEINLPNPHSYTNTRLGTWYGRLCMITDTNNPLDSGHDMWVMKKQGVEISWSKVCSFTLGLGADHITDQYRVLNIMDDGRILMVDTSSNLIIYNTSARSYKKLNTSECVIDYNIVSGIEYATSRVSPSRLCF